jgi:hypothetical protein
LNNIGITEEEISERHFFNTELLKGGLSVTVNKLVNGIITGPVKKFVSAVSW